MSVEQLQDSEQAEYQSLTRREGIVIASRLGLMDGKRHTLAETGELIAKSSRTVSKLQNSAISKLTADNPSKDTLRERLSSFTWPGVFE